MLVFCLLDVDVKELTQQCVGGHDLLQQRQKIQALSEETNQYLKKNVYQNYMQFIETAKEISCKSELICVVQKFVILLRLNKMFLSSFGE